MRKPYFQDDKFLADIRAAGEDTDSFHIWWLGQSGFLVQWRGRHLLYDPYLSDSLTKKYADTDKPHTRMTGLVIDPSRLDFIDVVTSSHNHTDHLDAETIKALIAANPKLQIVVPEANRAFAAQRLGVEPRSLLAVDDGTSVEAAGFTIHGVPAAHEKLERDDHGRYTHLGYVAEFAGYTIYHSGDTVPYDGMVEKLRPFAVDLALLPINGRLPARRVAGNLWGREAAQLAKDIGAKMVIPCHYDMFEFNTETPDEFVATCERIGQPYHVLRNGERWSSSMLLGAARR